MIDSKIDLNLLFTIVMRESKSTDIQEIDSDFYVYCTEYIGKLKTEEYDNIESKIKKNIIGIFTDLITILIELRFNKVINSNAFNLLLDEEKFVVETNYDFKNKQSLILSAILNGQNKLLENITNNLLIELLCMNDKNLIENTALEKIAEVINNGKAAEKFEKMVGLLGGPSDILSSYKKKLPSSACCDDIVSEHNGYIKSINTRALGIIMIELGGGRKQITDKIDYSVGFKDVSDVGKKVDKKTPLLKIVAKNKEDINRMCKRIRECFTISNNPIEPNKTIYKRIHKL